MLIDINAYVGQWPFMEFQYNTCQALGERMDKFGVDVSVISNISGVFHKNTQTANRELYEEIKSTKRYRDRFIPFAIINPIYAGWRDDMDTCIHKLGMKGIRVYPKYHDYGITDPALVELVKRARDMDVPVAFSYRIVDSRQRSWMDIDYVPYGDKPEWSIMNILPIIKEVPDAKFMILNVANSFSLTGENQQLLKDTKVLIDTSGRTLTHFPGAKVSMDLGDLLKVYGTEKFAFGTHSPILDYLTGLLRIESMDDSVADEATKERLRSGNAREFLNI